MRIDYGKKGYKIALIALIFALLAISIAGQNGLNGVNGTNGTSSIMGTLTYALHNTSSGISVYLNMNSIIVADVPKTYRYVNSTANGDTAIVSFLSPSLNLTLIPAGAILVHIDASKVGGINHNNRLWFDVGIVNATGQNYNSIGISAPSTQLITTSETAFDLSGVMLQRIVNTTDRLMLIVYVNQDGSGSLPNVTAYMDDLTLSRLVIPAIPIDLTSLINNIGNNTDNVNTLLNGSDHLFIFSQSGSTTYLYRSDTNTITSSTNFSKFVQDTINSISTGTLYFRDGRYNLTSSIVLKTGITMEGESMNNTLFYLNDHSNVIMINTVFAARAVEVRRLHLYGNAAGQDAGQWDGLQLNSCDYCTVSDMIIERTKWDGIIIPNGHSNTVHNIFVSAPSDNGITLFSSDATVWRGHKVSDVYIESSGLEGVGMGGEGGSILTNIVTNNCGRGVVSDGGIGNIITGHTSISDLYGAFFASDQTIYTDFRIINARANGIRFTGSTQTVKSPTDAIISSGYISNSTLDGILISPGQRIRIDKVTVNGSKGNGVFINNYTTALQYPEQIYFSHVTVMNNTLTGILIGANNSRINNVSIVDSLFMNNGDTYAIRVNNSATVTKLVMHDNELLNNTYLNLGTITTLLKHDNDGIP